jgi:hypothetical protein
MKWNSSAGRTSISGLDVGTDKITKANVNKGARTLELRTTNSRMRSSQLFYPIHAKFFMTL